MSVEPARLYSALLNSGLQQKDPALYQVINLLIGLVVSLVNQVGGSSSSGGSGGGSTTNIVNNIIQQLGLDDSSGGISGETEDIVVPGLPGKDGKDGISRIILVDDSYIETNPIIVPASLSNLAFFTPGSVLFAGTNGKITQDNANLFWDNTNKRLGIGINTPNESLHVRGNVIIDITSSNPVLFLQSSGITTGSIRSRTDITAFQILTDRTNYDLYLQSNGGGAVRIGNSAAQPVQINNTSLGISVTFPSAKLHIGAGTATANTAPLKFNSGTLLTAAEVGAIEFLTDVWYGTITTGTARKGFVLDDGARLTSGNIPVATTNGRLIDGPVATSLAPLASPSFTGTAIFGGPLTLKGYTVATLPTGAVGQCAYCTDLLTPAFLAIAVGGGAITGPVFHNGTNWVAF